jgi:hypothetical protein
MHCGSRKKIVTFLCHNSLLQPSQAQCPLGWVTSYHALETKAPNLLGLCILKYATLVRV